MVSTFSIQFVIIIIVVKLLSSRKRIDTFCFKYYNLRKQ